MVNITTVEANIWTSQCPAPIYGASTGDSPVPFWEGVASGSLDAHRTGWIIAGAFACVNTIFALTLIAQHLRHYHEPQYQRYYVRLILMIPIYSIVSFLGYRFYNESTYYELGLSFYEALVIASFFILILNFLGAEGKTRDVLSRGRRMRFMPPICCFRFDTSGWYFLEVTKWCVLQYVIIQPCLSVAGVILKATDHLCEASFSLQFGHAWLSIIEFFSVSVATFALIQFYLVIRHDIATFKPLWKFIAIKLVIFLSFYQTIILTILGYFHVIKPTQFWSVDNISHGLNSLLLCIEMFLFCFLDAYAYSHREFRNSPNTRISTWRALVDAFNILDLFVEVWHNLTWLFRAFILREKQLRTARDERFDVHTIHDARREMVRRETITVLAEDGATELKTGFTAYSGATENRPPPRDYSGSVYAPIPDDKEIYKMSRRVEFDEASINSHASDYRISEVLRKTNPRYTPSRGSGNDTPR